MRVPMGRWLPLLALLALGCASASELARRSEEAFHEGDFERAYTTARTALKLDEKNGRARAALSAAAWHLDGQWKQRVRNLAGVGAQGTSDTLGAADAALEYAQFRAEALGLGATLADDAQFQAERATVLEAAAAFHYRSGVGSLATASPKEAWRRFVSADHYVPGYRDVEVRIEKTHALAIDRVAILPFDNETMVQGLSRELADRMASEVARRLGPQHFEFTQLVSPQRIYGTLTVSQLGDLGRDEAFDLGRDLGANRVVWGRYRNLRTEADTDRYHTAVFRKVVERDKSDRSRERYVEFPFDAVERERRLWMRWEYEVLDVDHEEVVARGGDDLFVTAATVWTDFVAEGDCDAYSLYTPRTKAESPARCAQIDEEWKAAFGRWPLPKLLDHARGHRSRRQWRTEYRSELLQSTRGYPVFVNDLPGIDDLTFVALDGIWEPVFQTLKDLDGKD